MSFDTAVDSPFSPIGESVDSFVPGAVEVRFVRGPSIILDDAVGPEFGLKDGGAGSGSEDSAGIVCPGPADHIGLNASGVSGNVCCVQDVGGEVAEDDIGLSDTAMLYVRIFASRTTVMGFGVLPECWQTKMPLVAGASMPSRMLGDVGVKGSVRGAVDGLRDFTEVAELCSTDPASWEMELMQMVDEVILGSDVAAPNGGSEEHARSAGAPRWGEALVSD